MAIVYKVLEKPKQMNSGIVLILVIASLLFAAVSNDSGNEFLIRMIVTAVLSVLFLLPNSQQVTLDQHGIKWRNLWFHWEIKWPDLDYWEVSIDAEQPRVLCLYEKTGRYRCLPWHCIDDDRMLAVEKELQRRLPRAPIPVFSTLRASPEWNKRKIQ